MPFNSFADASHRLHGNRDKVTKEEVRDLMEWVTSLGEGDMRRLYAELALQNLEAIQKFDESSGRLTTWLIILTGVLVGLTGVILWFTILLARGAG